MKKLLNILGAITIASSTTSTVISCGGKSKNHSDENITRRSGNHNRPGYSSLQNNMLDGAEFMTKLILSSRHENMNFNVNEYLSSLLTPNATTLTIPTSFNESSGIKNTLISDGLNNYLSVLAPSLSNLDKNHYAGAYASYIMGMYGDEFYNNMLNNNYFVDSISSEGNKGFNKTGNDNSMGYASGLLLENQLETDDEDRERLAWGIQDNGALTNYLLDQGVDGGNPGDTPSTGSVITGPSLGGGGTNSAGYLFYNSITTGSKSNHNGNSISTTLNDKFKNKNLSLTDQTDKGQNFYLVPGKTTWDNAILNDSSDGSTINFGQTGDLYVRTAANLNIQGQVTKYASMFSSIDNSETGIKILSTFLNEICPIIDGGPTSQQNIVSKFIYDGFGSFWKKEKKGFVDGVLDHLKSLDPTIDWEQYEGVTWHNPSPLFGAKKRINEVLDKDSMLLASKMIQQIVVSYNKLDTAGKAAFANDAFPSLGDGFISKGYKDTIIGDASIQAKDWDSVLMQNNGKGGIDLLNLLSAGLKGISEHYDAILEIQDKDKNEWNGNSYYNLTNLQKKEYLSILGYKNSQIEAGSFIEDALINFTKTDGHLEIEQLFDKFLVSINDQMNDLYDKELKYVYSDDYWNESGILVSTSNDEQGGTMEFTLDYTGVGDSTSNADQQYNKVNKEKLDNFNPYQTIRENQSEIINKNSSLLDNDRTSGEVLGKDLVSDLKAYDGTGMLENMKPVHHKYAVKWENVSNDKNTPYWIISSIHCYNENDNGQEFFNIY